MRRFLDAAPAQFVKPAEYRQRVKDASVETEFPKDAQQLIERYAFIADASELSD